MKIKHQPGFNLIELMIVVAIVGILSAIATPTYQKYSARARISELFSIASGIQGRISEAYNAGNTTWSTLTDLNYSSTDLTSTYISSVTVSRTGTDTNCPSGTYIGTFTITGNHTKIGLSSVAGDKLKLIKVGCATNDVITWKCGLSSDTTAGFSAYFPTDCNTEITP